MEAGVRLTVAGGSALSGGSHLIDWLLSVWVLRSGQTYGYKYSFHINNHGDSAFQTG